ncbi:diguanylate cyclase (GGDEF) domain-containing protein [Ruminococcus sp. YE71]|nr:GGDEF domain-containing protein [Ruminococcus sp. YE78]SDA26756.1 diguanylate cyclase (GGDEF) domain-containing protein [Ruminococcus sp. YE78]SFW44483.1 diguanylate cyclase (GGDEF) domain-containing protein [Ruminococcus sp. YE71]
MYYASIGMISLVVLVIINIEALKKVEKTKNNDARLKYRQYLLSIAAFFMSDILWGFLYEKRWLIPAYIDTCMFFGTMALSVLLWTKGVVAFTGNKGRLGKIFVTGGWVVLMYEVAVLIINLFVPVIFMFKEDKEYVTLNGRHIGLIMQVILFLVTSVYAMVMAVRSEGMSRSHYRTISLSGLIMSFFVAVQMLFPLMPFYSMGCLFCTCLIHTFVYKDKDVEYDLAIKLAKQKAYRDGLTGVKNKLAYLEALAELETSVEIGEVTEYGVVVFDVNGLKTINDTMGHEAGDEHIKSACKIICHRFDHSPVFRIGGDEFVAILKGEDFENRESLAQAFRETIEENLINGLVTVASGLAVYDPAKDDSYNDVFKRADKSMYEHKRALKAKKNNV